MKIDPINSRLESFGARVFTARGNNYEELSGPAFLPADGRPSVILSYSCPYEGIELMKKNAPKFHYMRFKNEDEKKIYMELLKSWKS
jgi:transketolase